MKWCRYRIVVIDDNTGSYVFDDKYAGQCWQDALWQCAVGQLVEFTRDGCHEQILLPLRNAVSGARSIARSIDLRGSTPRRDRQVRTAVHAVRDALEGLDGPVWHLWRERCWRPS